MVSFTELLSKLNKGCTAREASHLLDDLLEQVAETGKSGYIAISLHVQKSAARQTFRVTDSIKVWRPSTELIKPALLEYPKHSTTLWLNSSGALTTDQEAQEPLFKDGP